MKVIKYDNSISIKELTQQDVLDNFHRISDLLEESYRVSFSDYEMEKKYFDSKVEVLSDYISQNKAIIFGAFDVTLKGFIWCFVRAYLNENRIHVNHFVVDNELRGLGIGKRLIDEIEVYALKHKINVIDLMVTRESLSVNFYEKNGYEIDRYQMIKRMGSK